MSYTIPGVRVYRTRGGERATVTHRYDNDRFPWLGFVYHSGCVQSESWTKGGRKYMYFATETDDDIIGPWVEEKATAESIADIDLPSMRHITDRDERIAGCRQMLEDLERLAKSDGCIAAAWALEVITNGAKVTS